ncbi:MAG TPA: threonine synthase [Anaerolineales bacterium]|nr:threonine synthase [Anaerolineales bacterium]
MGFFTGYRCSVCGQEYGPDEVTYTCLKDGGNLDVILDYDSLKAGWKISDLTLRAEPSLWRYQPLLPVGDPWADGTPLRAAGWTPHFRVEGLASQIGLERLWIKDESRNPTASFKDRASAVVVTRAREIGAQVVVTASTGNAGAALAGMAAAVGQRAVILAPRTAPPAKVAQLLVYGAEVLLVEGTYDEAFDLSVQVADEFGWYCRNTGYNPFTAEGKKTASFEIWENILLPRYYGRRPLSIFVSVGDGNIISGMHKGFVDLQRMGWLETMPRLYGVQAAGSAAVANAFKAGTDTIVPVKASTLADSISVDLPRDGYRALRAVRETGGSYITVEDTEILTAITRLGKIGIFAEPAGSTAFAGLVKAVGEGLVQADDPVVVMVTGSGLKDVGAAREAAGEAPVIEPTLQAVLKHFK